MAEQLLSPVFLKQVTKVVKFLKFSDTTGTQIMVSDDFFFFFSPARTCLLLVDSQMSDFCINDI